MTGLGQRRCPLANPVAVADRGAVNHQKEYEGLAGIGPDVFVEGVGMRRVGVVKGLPESAQPVAQRQDQIVIAEGRWRV